MIEAICDRCGARVDVADEPRPLGWYRLELVEDETVCGPGGDWFVDHGSTPLICSTCAAAVDAFARGKDPSSPEPEPAEAVASCPSAWAPDAAVATVEFGPDELPGRRRIASACNRYLGTQYRESVHCTRPTAHEGYPESCSARSRT